jgi:hypothetical protein
MSVDRNGSRAPPTARAQRPSPVHIPSMLAVRRPGRSKYGWNPSDQRQGGIGEVLHRDRLAQATLLHRQLGDEPGTATASAPQDGGTRGAAESSPLARQRPIARAIRARGVRAVRPPTVCRRRSSCRPSHSNRPSTMRLHHGTSGNEDISNGSVEVRPARPKHVDGPQPMNRWTLLPCSGAITNRGVADRERDQISP